MAPEVGALPEPVAPTEKTGRLRELCMGGAVTVREPIVVSGRITTSDAAGNFFRTFMVEDDTGAVEIMAGLYDMYRSWPVGMRVSVRLQGLAVERRRGVLRAGLPAGAWSSYDTEYMAHAAVVARYVERSGDIIPPEPREVTAGGLSQQMCGMLVRLRGMRLDGGATSWARRAADGTLSTGYRTFRDAAGDSVIVETSPYARFAGQQIELRPVTLCGVLMYDGCYRLKLRDENDAEYE